MKKWKYGISLRIIFNFIIRGSAWLIIKSMEWKGLMCVKFWAYITGWNFGYAIENCGGEISCGYLEWMQQMRRHKNKRLVYYEVVGVLSKRVTTLRKLFMKKGTHHRFYGRLNLHITYNNCIPWHYWICIEKTLEPPARKLCLVPRESIPQKGIFSYLFK